MGDSITEGAIAALVKQPGETCAVDEVIAQIETDKVTIDVSRAHIWDISSVQALDMAVLKFRRDGAEVEIVGMNEASETIVDKLAIHDKPGAMDKLMAH